MNHPSRTTCLFWLALIHLCAASALQGAANAVRFEPSAPTFGRIQKWQELDPTLGISVVNKGNKEIKIRRVSMGCGCMSASFDRPVSLAPGQSTEIVVTLNQNQIVRGAHSYPLTLYSAEGPIDAISVKYEYDPVVDLAAREIFINSDERDAPALTELRASTEEHAKSLVVSADTDYLDTRIVEGDGKRLLQIKCQPNHPFGRFTHRVYVSRTGQSERDAIVTVHCDIATPAEARPAMLLLGVLTPNKETQRTITITGQGAYKVISFGGTVPEIKVAADQSDGHYRITVTPKVEAQGTTVEGMVYFSFDGPRPFTLEVPVIGEVASTPKQ